MATPEAAESTPSSEDPSGNCKINDKTILETEIASLSADFKGQCRSSDDVKGRFVKIVKLHPDNLDIVFNFKLLDTYPKSAPVIEIRSESLEEDEIFDLLTFMNQNAESISPVRMDVLVNDALEWLKEGGINLRGGRNKRNAKSSNGENKGKKSKKSKKKKPVDVEDKKKKVPMRTAIDVVERVQWDAKIQQDECIVGYLDRMKGLQEKYFTAFSWEDIASVDYTVLAIPKHRIQYFKYKGEIVWDKRNRLDNVFGSTGSGITIHDVIARIENKTSTGNTSQGSPAADNEDHVDSDYYDDGDSSDSDSDSDDGVEVVIGETSYDGRFSGSNEDEEDESDNDTGLDKYWRDKLRPNYFLALRVTDEAVRDQVKEIQNYIASNDGRLKECAIPVSALHITLCTVGLETPEQVQNAVQCLKEAKEELEGIVPKSKKLKFKGLDTFFNRVVYGRVLECPQEFHDFVDHLKLCLTEKGIDIRDYHEFVPHMTLAKISRPFSRATGKKYIPPWLYSCFGEAVLGEQSVDNIHLCEMGDNRQSDGFYITAASLDI